MKLPNSVRCRAMVVRVLCGVSTDQSEARRAEQQRAATMVKDTHARTALRTRTWTPIGARRKQHTCLCFQAMVRHCWIGIYTGIMKIRVTV